MLHHWLPVIALTLAVTPVGCQQPAPPAPDPSPAAAPSTPAPPTASEARPEAAEPTGASAPERPGVVERKGEPRTLVGRDLTVGDPAPDFELVDPALGRVRSADFAGKVVLLSVVPSIDTPVCEAQTGRLASEQAGLPAGVALLTVSRDLPFAQKRFLADNQFETPMASDFDAGKFGRDWGLYIKESGLLARSLWVIGKDGKIAYRQIVREQSTEPEYDSALAAAKAAAAAP